MKYLRVKNWQKWQSYRKDRGTPPWIKVHRNLLTNPKWAVLSDADKGQLISIWMVAADNGGEVPDNSSVIRKICQLDSEPNMSKFKELGFLDDERQPSGNQVVTICPQLDAPETETETYNKETYSKETETKSTKKDCHFDIEIYLDDKLREQIKMDAPRLDFNGYILPAYKKFMIGKEMPKNPIGSFRGFVKKCYKDYVAKNGVP